MLVYILSAIVGFLLGFFLVKCYRFKNPKEVLTTHNHMVGRKCKTGIAFTLRREMPFTKELMSYLGAKEESTTSDPSFDSRVYIESDFSAISQILKSNPRAKEIVLELLRDNKRISKIVCDTESLILCVKGSKQNLKENIAHVVDAYEEQMDELSEIITTGLKSLEATRHSPKSILAQNDRAVYRKIENTLAIHVGICVSVFVQSFAHAITNKDQFFPIYGYNFSILSLLALSFFSVIVITSLIYCSNSTRSYKILWSALFCAALSSPMLAFQSYTTLNTSLDKSTPKLLLVNFETYSYRSGKNRVYQFFLTKAQRVDSTENFFLEPYNGKFAQQKLSISNSLYNSLPQKGVIMLEIREGFFSSPYYERIGADLLVEN